MYELRDYQRDAVRNAVQFFQKKREPALVVLPTGAGKSLVIAELARIAKGRVLVLAHVKELVEQNPDIVDYRIEILNYYFEKKDLLALNKEIEYLESTFNLNDEQIEKISKIKEII